MRIVNTCIGNARAADPPPQPSSYLQVNDISPCSPKYIHFETLPIRGPLFICPAGAARESEKTSAVTLCDLEHHILSSGTNRQLYHGRSLNVGKCRFFFWQDLIDSNGFDSWVLSGCELLEQQAFFIPPSSAETFLQPFSSLSFSYSRYIQFFDFYVALKKKVVKFFCLN